MEEQLNRPKPCLKKARGGILFIDEAYSLDKKGQRCGLWDRGDQYHPQIMEDNRDDIMIIFAGYTKEMEEFLKTNPGLRSRVPNNFIFEDFTGDEIVQLGENDPKQRGLQTRRPGLLCAAC